MGNAQNPILEELATFRHPQEFHNDLIEKTRPIFTACLKAIREDRREIALVCLDELNLIAETYISTFGESISISDEFHLFLLDQFDILFDVAIDVTNQQFTSDIVHTIILIANHSLIFTDESRKENHLIGMWVRFLGSSIIKSIHLEHTTAQGKAVNGIIEIGKSLIERQDYQPALFVVGAELKKSGSTIVSIKHTSRVMITRQIGYGLLKLLAYYVMEARKTSTYYESFIQKMCHDLNDILSLAYKRQSHDVQTLDWISDSIVSWGDINLATLISIILTDWPDEPARTEFVLLDGVRDILFLVNQGSQSALSLDNAPVENYCKVLSEMSWVIIGFIEQNKNTHALESATTYLKHVVKISESIIQYITKNNSNWSFQDFKNLSPIYAFLIFFHSYTDKKIFIEIYTKGLESLIKIFEESVITNSGNQTNRILYSYLKLYGAWLNHFESKSVTVSRLISVLRKNILFDDRFQNMGYPISDFSEDWRIIPSRMWGENVNVISTTLNNHKILADFNNLLEKKRRTKKAI